MSRRRPVSVSIPVQYQLPVTGISPYRGDTGSIPVTGIRDVKVLHAPDPHAALTARQLASRALTPSPAPIALARPANTGPIPVPVAAAEANSERFAQRAALNVQDDVNATNGGRPELPAELRAELRRLWTAILVKSYLADEQGLSGDTVKAPGERNRG